MEGLFQNDLILLKKFGEYYRYYYTIYKNFPKIDKYGIGKEVFDENLMTWILIFKASVMNKKDFRKKKYFIEANEKLDVIRFLIRQMFEMEIVNRKRNTILSVQLVEIGKMLGGLINPKPTNKDQ